MIEPQVDVLYVNGIGDQRRTQGQQLRVIKPVVEVQLIVPLYHDLERIVFIVRLLEVFSERLVGVDTHFIALLAVKGQNILLPELRHFSLVLLVVFFATANDLVFCGELLRLFKVVFFLHLVNFFLSLNIFLFLNFCIIS